MAQLSHSVESCPIYNEDTKKKLKELSIKRDEIASNYQIKILVAVFSQLEHLIIYVVEAPDHKAFERYLRGIGLAFYNKIEIKEMELIEDAFKTL